MSRNRRVVLLYGAVGALLGAFVLHPVTMVIYWFEFNPSATGSWNLVAILGQRSIRAFTGAMGQMALLLATLGAGVGAALGIAAQALAKRGELLDSLRAELRQDIASLIVAGESERTEFKSSARWDYVNNRRNRAIEEAVARAIAGFMNHHGGNLLIGVDDDGQVLGLEHDYHTLRSKDRDGFEQFVMGLVKTRLGGDVCPRVHPLFHQLDGKEVCRLVIEPSRRPVYARKGDADRYYLRTGNATRELDVQEAVKHIAERYPAA